MKLGLGLYRSLLTQDNYAFAKQAGVTHLVVHLVDYFKGSNPVLASGPTRLGWGVTQNQDRPWTYEEIAAIKKDIEANGLTWEAIENFDPSHWYDVLLDGPRKHEQMETLKRTINVSNEPELVGALGAALLALRRLEKLRSEKSNPVEEARVA